MGKKRGGTHGGSEQESRAEEAFDLRLKALLGDLVQRQTHKGAAVELGVGYKTLLRFKESGRLTKRLRLALERYLREGPEAAESEWWRQFGELERRVGALEASTRQLEGSLSGLRRELVSQREKSGEQAAQVEHRLAQVEAELHDLRRLAEVQDGSEQPHHRPARASVPATAQVVAESGSGKQGGLAQAWGEAVAAEEGARTRLERAKAEGRRLEIELALIQEHRESVPPGEAWDDARRSREVAWRWEALEDRRRERRRLERQRWLRRILTLGLWWP